MNMHQSIRDYVQKFLTLSKKFQNEVEWKTPSQRDMVLECALRLIEQLVFGPLQGRLPSTWEKGLIGAVLTKILEELYVPTKSHIAWRDWFETFFKESPDEWLAPLRQLKTWRGCGSAKPTRFVKLDSPFHHILAQSDDESE